MATQQKFSLTQDSFTELVNTSRQKAMMEDSVIVGHSLAIHHNVFTNHAEIATWARQLGCNSKTYPGVTVIDIVPIGYQKDIFPQ